MYCIVPDQVLVSHPQGQVVDDFGAPRMQHIWHPRVYYFNLPMVGFFLAAVVGKCSTTFNSYSFAENWLYLS